MADATNAPFQEKKAGRPKSVKPETDGIDEDYEKWPKEYAAINREFDPERKYMFQLAKENPEPELPSYFIQKNKSYAMPYPKFKPFVNMVYTSQIVWKGQRRILRYYDGCTSIFADEQPKDRETIQAYITGTKRRNFVHGKFGVNGDERMLLLYMYICSWNSLSEFRTKTASEVFKPVDDEKEIALEINELDQVEHAMQLAKEASENKMLMHAKYLDLDMVDRDSQNDLTPSQIRVAYRKYARNEPAKFIESYGNKAIEIKYYIDKALEQQIIKYDKNRTFWGKSGNDIMDTSGISSLSGIAQALFEHSQLDAGEEFVIQLRALFE